MPPDLGISGRNPWARMNARTCLFSKFRRKGTTLNRAAGIASTIINHSGAPNSQSHAATTAVQIHRRAPRKPMAATSTMVVRSVSRVGSAPARTPWRDSNIAVVCP